MGWRRSQQSHLHRVFVITMLCFSSLQVKTETSRAGGSGFPKTKRALKKVSAFQNPSHNTLTNISLAVFWVSRSTFTFREEIPSHVAWSADGSLLAVSLGPYVVLYDPVTNALLQVLATPECNRVVAAYFLGDTSRYLAVVGKLDVALWDLITQTCKSSAI